jgi:hypothetical protein
MFLFGYYLVSPELNSSVLAASCKAKKGTVLVGYYIVSSEKISGNLPMNRVRNCFSWLV